MSQSRFIIDLKPVADCLKERLNHLFTPLNVPLHEENNIEFPDATIHELVVDVFNRYMYWDEIQFISELSGIMEDPMVAILEPYTRDQNLCAQLTTEVYRNIDNAVKIFGGINRDQTYNVNMVSSISILVERIEMDLPYQSPTL